MESKPIITVAAMQYLPEDEEKFIKWYELNRSKIADYGDPRIEKFDLVYFLVTGKTIE